MCTTQTITIVLLHPCLPLRKGYTIAITATWDTTTWGVMCISKGASAQMACAFEKWVSCSSCRRYFVSDKCYQTHLTLGMCNVMRTCSDCGKVYYTYSKHVCGMVFCKMCGHHQPQDHLCFIKPLNRASEGDDEEEGC